MLPNTLLVIKTVLAGDDSVSPEEIKVVIDAAMKGAQSDKPKDRILSRKAVAERFGVTTKTIDNWRLKGVLSPLVIPGSTKAIGYRESDVDSLIAGSTVQNAV